MLFIEGLGGVIDRIDDDAQDGSFRVYAPGSSIDIDEQRASKTLPLITLVDGEASDQHGGEVGIPRQSLEGVGREVVEPDRCRGESVIAGQYPRCHLDYDKRLGDVPARVLRDLGPKIAIKRGVSAGESVALRFEPLLERGLGVAAMLRRYHQRGEVLLTERPDNEWGVHRVLGFDEPLVSLNILGHALVGGGRVHQQVG